MHGFAHLWRQERQEGSLSFTAQAVHVKACRELVFHVAEDIEPGNEIVVDPLEQREIDYPGGFGHRADEACHHRGGREITVDGQTGIDFGAITLPDVTVVGAAFRQELAFIPPLAKLLILDRSERQEAFQTLGQFSL